MGKEMVLAIASLGTGMCPKAQVGRGVEEEGKPRRLRGLLPGLPLVLLPLALPFRDYDHYSA